MMQTNTLRARRRSAGFTLVEILISLGIFLIGMTAIVSLFPAAAILQRETAQEVISEMAAQSAAGIIEATELTYDPPGAGRTAANLNFYHTTAGSTNTSVSSITGLYPYTDRSYPTGLVNGLDVSNCDLHWVPFIQDINGDPANPNWVVRLFVLDADSRAEYTPGNAADANPADPITFPKVRQVGASATGSTFTVTAGTDLEVGDIIMDSNGNSHEVINLSGNDIEVVNAIPRVPNAPNSIYYAPRLGGTSSPAMRVVTVEVNVVAP